MYGGQEASDQKMGGPTHPTADVKCLNTLTGRLAPLSHLGVDAVSHTPADQSPDSHS